MIEQSKNAPEDGSERPLVPPVDFDQSSAHDSPVLSDNMKTLSPSLGDETLAASVPETSRFSKILRKALDQSTRVQVQGKVADALGTVIRVTGLEASIGEICRLQNVDGSQRQAEVIGLSRQYAILAPFGPLEGISNATTVEASGQVHQVPFGRSLCGRILDGLGKPLDGLPLTNIEHWMPALNTPPNALKRQMIAEIMPTGVRAMDACLSLGVGQRVGVFAPAGVGKSTLLGMLAKGVKSDINVIALIGERGREVREFVEEILGPQGLERSVLVVSTSDRPSMERARAAHVATAIAEGFRDQGLNVLLMMDSLTRYARAQRELGLAAGEPPARRGFPPSTFAELPRLLERAGQGEKGSITAIYTILQESDDDPDPIAEEVRSLLDGHIVLSRKLGEKGHFPAIDVLASVSRVMPLITTAEHRQMAQQLREWMSKYKEIEILLQMGEYKAGSDGVADLALTKMSAIEAFLRQSTDEQTPLDVLLANLKTLVKSK